MKSVFASKPLDEPAEALQKRLETRADFFDLAQLIIDAAQTLACELQTGAGTLENATKKQVVAMPQKLLALATEVRKQRTA